MTRDTTLIWGAKSDELADLRDFEAEVQRQLDHARRKAPVNAAYRRMIDSYEHELADLKDQIDRVENEKRGRRST